MKQLIGLFKGAEINREFGALSAFLYDCTQDRAEAKYIAYLIGNILYIARLDAGEETLVAMASNFTLRTK